MGLKDAIGAALDAHGKGAGTVKATDGQRSAEVEVKAVDRIGVRVGAIRVDKGAPVDVTAESAALPERLRSLGESVQPVEVDPGMGGAILRTKPDQMRSREFFEVQVDGKGTTGVRRLRASDQGGREAVDFDVTRDQLGRILDEL